MSEFTKDFIKFIAEVILILIILSVVFNEEGVVSNSYNFLLYAEPILVQNFISNALTTADYAPGEFSTAARVSGAAYKINIYKEAGVSYVSIDPEQSVLLNTRFVGIKPAPILVNCTLDDQTIILKKDVTRFITIKKEFVEEGCKLSVII